MSAEKPELSSPSLASPSQPGLPGFVEHPGDVRTIHDDMGPTMPDEDLAAYDAGEVPGEADGVEDTPVVALTAESDTSVEQKKDETVTALDKLRTIREELGFLPLDREELNEIWRIRQHLGEAGGSAKDLNILLLHQRDATKVTTDDPEALLRKKVHTWGDYFRQTIRDRTLIKDVADFVAKYPDMKGSEVIQYYSKSVDYAPRALRPVKSVGVLDQLVRGDAIPANVARNPFEQVDDMWREGLDAISIGELRAMMALSYTMNNHRHGFWYTILAQARQHDTVKFLVADYIGP